MQNAGQIVSKTNGKIYSSVFYAVFMKYEIERRFFHKKIELI
jgi:hypothetical protein